MPIDPSIRRCEHIRANGTRCGSPALRGNDFCYYHHQARTRRRGWTIPLLEDADAIQVAVQETLHALAAGSLEPQTATVIFSGLRLAASNAKFLENDHGAMRHGAPVTDFAATSSELEIAHQALGQPSASPSASEDEINRKKAPAGEQIHAGDLTSSAG